MNRSRDRERDRKDAKSRKDRKDRDRDRDRKSRRSPSDEKWSFGRKSSRSRSRDRRDRDRRDRDRDRRDRDRDRDRDRREREKSRDRRDSKKKKRRYDSDSPVRRKDSDRSADRKDDDEKPKVRSSRWDPEPSTLAGGIRNGPTPIIAAAAAAAVTPGQIPHVTQLQPSLLTDPSLLAASQSATQAALQYKRLTNAQMSTMMAPEIAKMARDAAMFAKEHQMLNQHMAPISVTKPIISTISPLKPAGKLDMSALKEMLNKDRTMLREYVIKAKSDYENKHTRLQSSPDANQDGYLLARDGEELGTPPRYIVEGAPLGSGAFSCVFRCKDITNPSHRVAVKVIRNDKMMRKAAEKEIDILRRVQKQAEKDKNERFIELIASFDHNTYFCMSFPLVWKNLRGALKEAKANSKTGGGFQLPQVQMCAKQIFEALQLLAKLRIVHADIKPDNILIDQQMTYIKVCDLGSAMDVDDCFITCYLGPRYYRAPEVMLGCKYDCSLDTWSAGCTIFELFTGTILFTGENNNEMLRAFMDVQGPIPERMRTEGQFANQHFLDTGDFVKGGTQGSDLPSEENIMPANSLRAITTIGQVMQQHQVEPSGSGPLAEIHKQLYRVKANQLAELVTKCLRIDPQDRISAEVALTHPFIVGSAT